MRGLVLCAVALSAHADVAVTSPRPDWIPKCLAALQGARDQHARKYPRFRSAWVRDVGPRKDDPHGVCGHHVVEVVQFEQPEPRSVYGSPVYSAQIAVRSGVDQGVTSGWKQVGSADVQSFERSDRGRTASVTILQKDAADADEFFALFRSALDRCIDAAPAAPAPPPPPADAEVDSWCARDAASVPLSRCRDAQRAAVVLEAICQVEGDGIGDGGIPGRTLPALARIVALGAAATPILLRLSRSPNATARAVAAKGFARIRSSAGRAALLQLSDDHQRTATLDGCIGSSEEVSEFAREALRKYP
jgi:hypothetical protein